MKIFISLICCLLVFSCIRKEEKNYKFHEGPIQGTMFHITYEWDKDLSKEIDSLLQTFNSYLSNYDPNSIISKINYNTSDKLNDLVSKMIITSFEVNENTDGAFDITIAPIANLWGFGWEKKQSNIIPDSTQIDSLMQFVGMDKIAIHNNLIRKSYSEVMIIGNAIAQGLSADYVSDYFNELGLENYIIEIGGEVYCKGVNSKNIPWRVGIDKPIENSGYENRESQLIVSLSNKAIATSGNYRKYIENGGKKLGHSIDPRTGYPAENSLLCVSVISNSTMISDAYATAFMVLGLEKSMQITENLDDFESYFIYIDSNGNEDVAYSSGFSDYIYKD